MPTCACLEHDRICSGESGPILKISNKKINNRKTQE